MWVCKVKAKRQRACCRSYNICFKHPVLMHCGFMKLLWQLEDCWEIKGDNISDYAALIPVNLDSEMTQSDWSCRSRSSSLFKRSESHTFPSFVCLWQSPPCWGFLGWSQITDERNFKHSHWAVNDTFISVTLTFKHLSACTELNPTRRKDIKHVCFSSFFLLLWCLLQQVGPGQRL